MHILQCLTNIFPKGLKKYNYLGQNMDGVHVHGMVKRSDF